MTISATPKLSPEQLRMRGWLMPGSIRKRGSSYALRLYVGKQNGITKYKWLTFHSRQEAEAAQRELASHTMAHAAGTGLYGSPRERLGTYLTDWVRRQDGRLAPKTCQWYRIIATQVRADPLGTIPLARLTPRALEAYYGRKLAQRLSSTTVLHHHRLLHTALASACRQDLIVKNPAAFAEAPRRRRSDLSVWTESETVLFLSDAQQHSRYYRLYLFLVATGARLGEALRLIWRDVDLRSGTVTVQRSKTPASRRTITLPPECVQELERLRAHAPRDDRLVFCQTNGKPLHANNIRQRDLYPRARALGLPWRRAFHNFRHAHATMLLHHGISAKIVQERLGHSQAGFTLSTYGHVLAGMQAPVTDVISTLLRACTSPAPPPLAGHHAESIDDQA
jgi:integrase